MKRITEANLEKMINQINHKLKMPMWTYTSTKEKKCTANVGNYHLEWAYGGVRLVQIISKGGAISVILDSFVTKREMFQKLQAFIAGMEA